MYITWRNSDNREYWQKRWMAIPADAPVLNENVYPLKYALLCVSNQSESILEAGCGNGRVLRYFKERGYDVTGIDFIAESVQKLKQVDSTLNVETGDVTPLRWSNETTDAAYAVIVLQHLCSNCQKMKRNSI